MLAGDKTDKLMNDKELTEVVSSHKNDKNRTRTSLKPPGLGAGPQNIKNMKV